MLQNESSAIFLRMNLEYLFLILNCKNLVHEYKILPLKNTHSISKLQYHELISNMMRRCDLIISGT